MRSYLQWQSFPFLRLVFPFIGGVLMVWYVHPFLSQQSVMACFAFLTLTYVVVGAFRNKWGRVPPEVPGTIAIVWFFAFGYLIAYLKIPHYQPDHLVNLKSEITEYSAIVTGEGKETAKNRSYEIAVLHVRDRGQWQVASGQILLYVRKPADALKTGDLLFLVGVPLPVAPPVNPGVFDYRSYLAAKGVYHQHFTDTSKMVVYGHKSPAWYVSLSQRARKWARGVIETGITSEREQGIALALLLGIKDELGNEVRTAYSDTGAVHVLAVSGLHVGIIYMVTLWGLGMFQKVKRLKFVVPIAAIIILWGYAFITGLSPSVMRAVTMFSLVALSGLLNRRSNIYNTLAIAALVLLIIDPLMVLKVGFQLSFLAVLGIVYFQPPLYGLFEFEGRLADWTWKLSTVGIAAQITTFPLALYYFHQFPNYFILSNLVVIPCATIIVTGGVLLIIFGASTTLVAWTGFLLEKVLWVMNSAIFQLEKLPYSTLEGIHIGILQVCLLYHMVFLMVLFVKRKRFFYLAAFTAVLMAFIGMSIYQKWDSSNGTKVVFYKTSQALCIDFIKNRHVTFYSNGADEKTVEYILNPARASFRVGGATQLTNHIVFEDFEGLVWEDLRVLIVHRKVRYFPSDISIDFVVVRNNSIYSPEELGLSSVPRAIIFDNTNYPKRVEKIMRDFPDWPIISLHEGAWIDKL